MKIDKMFSDNLHIIRQPRLQIETGKKDEIKYENENKCCKTCLNICNSKLNSIN